jgi:hypothetical protein
LKELQDDGKNDFNLQATLAHPGRIKNGQTENFRRAVSLNMNSGESLRQCYKT